MDLVDDDRVRRRMSPSSNQRRAIPVVTMMTFQVGVSGVASRSRFTTPTFSSFVRRISSAIGRMASVFPVPVPAMIPKPRARSRASSRTRAPWCFSRNVSMCRRSASSIVSHAARVGAMTMTRPVSAQTGRRRRARECRDRERFGSRTPLKQGEGRERSLLCSTQAASAGTRGGFLLVNPSRSAEASACRPPSSWNRRNRHRRSPCRWKVGSSSPSGSPSLPAAAPRAHLRSRRGTSPSADARPPGSRFPSSRYPSAPRCCAMTGAAVATMRPTREHQQQLLHLPSTASRTPGATNRSKQARCHRSHRRDGRKINDFNNLVETLYTYLFRLCP